MQSMPKPRRISQQLIAKELGVSQSLVSLTLNGQHQRIHADTYQRIWDFAIKAGYKPKGIKLESSPETTQTQQIGVILRAGLKLHTQGGYFSQVMHGLHEALIDLGFSTVFLGSEDSLTDEHLRQSFGPASSIKGIVLMGEVAPKFLTRIRQHSTGIVAIASRHQGACHSVVGNEPASLQAIVKHLVSLGHRRIGWLGGNVGLGRHEIRHTAFKTELEAAGLKYSPRYESLQVEGDRIDGTEAMSTLLPEMKRADFPTAFVTYNIKMAIGAILALRKAHKSVPKDISIAAADFSEAAALFSPQITSAGCHPEALGRTAAQLAVDHAKSDSGTYQDLVLASQLHIGKSSGEPKKRPKKQPIKS